MITAWLAGLNKKKAKAKGWSWYIGRPCARGHGNKRLTRNSKCPECIKLEAANWANKNKDKIQAYSKNYRTGPHRQKLLNKKAAYRVANLNKIKAGVRAIQKRQRSVFSAAMVESQRRLRVERYGAEGNHTFQDVRDLARKQKYKCKVCRVNVRGKYHADHIQPLARGGTDWISNIQILCAPCNLSKGKKTMDEWLQPKKAA